MTRDLTTTEGFLDWLEWAKDRVAKKFAKDGKLRPTVFLITTRDAQTGRRFAEPVPALLYPTDFASQQDKDDFAGILRQAALTTHAIGIAFAAEAWMAHIDLPGMKPSEMTPEKAHALSAPLVGRVREHPSSIEVLSMTYEHITFPNLEIRAIIGHILRSQGHARVTSWGTGNQTMPSQFAGILQDVTTHTDWDKP